MVVTSAPLPMGAVGMAPTGTGTAGGMLKIELGGEDGVGELDGVRLAEGGTEVVGELEGGVEVLGCGFALCDG